MVKGHKISYSHKNYSILKGVDVSVDYGDMLVIVGPNGAGKSTLLNVLANEISRNTEDIYFKLKRFREWDVLDLSKNKAKFSQHHNGDIPLPVREVVLMGRYPYFDSIPRPADLEAIEEAMKEVGIWDLRDREYNLLSGGEKQRVHLARVMTQMRNEIAHKLVLLDEPLNNLDVKHQYQVLELMSGFAKKGNTVVTVLHDLNLAARFATRVLMMKNGTVLAQGAPGEVLTAEIISEAYGFPCSIWMHPVRQQPVILFGN
ncbi:heme ABC transporter ATP-binding protein [Leadbetterella sp. DM7]|uniref:heme ABC transporter ATP-binding protein n=1 Tax=Leadbetterella sp. DM7 TaxID=3235085 RepID=UPI00349F0045